MYPLGANNLANEDWAENQPDRPMAKKRWRLALRGFKDSTANNAQ